MRIVSGKHRGRTLSAPKSQAIRPTADRPREIEVTSYAELVLGPAADDLAHPAFGKLFLETEYIPHSAALVCHRRPRAAEDPVVAPPRGHLVVSAPSANPVATTAAVDLVVAAEANDHVWAVGAHQSVAVG